MAQMAPVDGAEHIAAAYAVLRTEAAVEVVVVAAAAAAAAAVVAAAAVEGHVAAQEVGPGAACYGAAPVAVGSKRP